MNKLIFSFIVLCILASCTSNPYLVRFEAPRSTCISAEVVSVIDGDTIHVRTSDECPGIPEGTHSVRMLFMDAPESSDNPKLERNLLQYFSRGIYVKKETVILLGKMAAERLKQLLRSGDRVELEFSTPEPTDKYGRLLAQVFRNGSNINFSMVSEGMADIYFLGETRGPSLEYYRKRFTDARNRAMNEHTGIWKTLK